MNDRTGDQPSTAAADTTPPAPAPPDGRVRMTSVSLTVEGVPRLSHHIVDGHTQRGVTLADRVHLHVGDLMLTFTDPAGLHALTDHLVQVDAEWAAGREAGAR